MRPRLPQCRVARVVRVVEDGDTRRLTVRRCPLERHPPRRPIVDIGVALAVAEGPGRDLAVGIAAALGGHPQGESAIRVLIETHVVRAGRSETCLPIDEVRTRSVRRRDGHSTLFQQHRWFVRRTVGDIQFDPGRPVRPGRDGNFHRLGARLVAFPVIDTVDRLPRPPERTVPSVIVLGIVIGVRPRASQFRTVQQSEPHVRFSDPRIVDVLPDHVSMIQQGNGNVGSAPAQVPRGCRFGVLCRWWRRLTARRRLAIFRAGGHRAQGREKKQRRRESFAACHNTSLQWRTWNRKIIGRSASHAHMVVLYRAWGIKQFRIAETRTKQVSLERHDLKG